MLNITASAAGKSLQLCSTLCDPRDGSPPGSPIPGILQARILEWVAISFSNAWKWKVKVKSLSRAWLLATPWTAAYQAPPPTGFSRQKYWSEMPLPSPAQRHSWSRNASQNLIPERMVFTKKTKGKKRWQRCTEKVILIHLVGGSVECKME